jgi:hypothetical protein
MGATLLGTAGWLRWSVVVRVLHGGPLVAGDRAGVYRLTRTSTPATARPLSSSASQSPLRGRAIVASRPEPDRATTNSVGRADAPFIVGTSLLRSSRPPVCAAGVPPWTMLKHGSYDAEPAAIRQWASLLRVARVSG